MKYGQITETFPWIPITKDLIHSFYVSSNKNVFCVWKFYFNDAINHITTTILQ